jgi:hypothetical protein
MAQKAGLTDKNRLRDTENEQMPKGARSTSEHRQLAGRARLFGASE